MYNHVRNIVATTIMKKPKNECSTLGDKIYKALVNQIINGKIKHGTRLIEDDLATNFRVSRTPVREALNKLVKDGLIELIPRKGGYVRGVTTRDIEEIYGIRKVLEGLAVCLATPLFRKADIARIKRLIQKSETYPEERKVAHFIKVDKTFHNLIIKSCSNKRLGRTIKSLHNIIHVFREMDAPLEERAKAALKEHEKILEAIEKGDAGLAKKLMSQHIEASKRSILIHFKFILK